MGEADLFGGEIALRLACLAASSGLTGANETCTNYGLPQNMFVELVQWGPITMTIGIVFGVPIAVFVVMKVSSILGKVSSRV